MRYCRKCGSQIDDEAVVCPKCGVPTDLYNKSNQGSANGNVTKDGISKMQDNLMGNNRKGHATASFTLGFVNLLLWLIPLLGFPGTIVGLIMGILGLQSTYRGKAIAGIVLCSICLLLTLINSIIGAYLGATGKLF